MSSRAEGSKKETQKKTEKIGYDPVGLRKCMEHELDPSATNTRWALPIRRRRSPCVMVRI